MRNRIVESVLTAVLLGILGAAWNTYNEVKELRFAAQAMQKDLSELRKDLDGLYAETSEQVQKLTPDKKRRE